jgi:hypothetical protein
MTCQHCGDPQVNDDNKTCLSPPYLPVSALGISERLQNMERVYRQNLTETKLVALGSVLGSLAAVIVMAIFVLTVTM